MPPSTIALDNPVSSLIGSGVVPTTGFAPCRDGLRRGRLVGNVQALHTILEMQRAEARAGISVTLVFNGDYNWLNAQPPAFREVNQTALANVAIQGNVEAEIAQPTEAGCGCNYPDYVNAGYVAASSAIMQRLQFNACHRMVK